MLLLGKPVVEHLYQETKEAVETYGLTGTYVQFFLVSHDEPSRVYVNRKCAYALTLGLEGRVTQQPERSVEQLLQAVEQANTDDACLGIVVQLPLSPQLQPHQATILTAVAPHKDLDGLGGVLFGLSATGHLTFIPATPKAVLEMLRYYSLDAVQGQTVALLGQSNLTGKPLAVELMNRGATVCSFNAESDQVLMKEVCAKSDIIISATGVVHLLDASFFSDPDALRQKVLLDVGRGIKDGKAVGDIDREFFQDRVHAITPVPGGIGPVTVACLFHNLITLQQAKKSQLI